jgi:hypothetical protein
MGHIAGLLSLHFHINSITSFCVYLGLQAEGKIGFEGRGHKVHYGYDLSVYLSIARRCMYVCGIITTTANKKWQQHPRSLGGESLHVSRIYTSVKSQSKQWSKRSITANRLLVVTHEANVDSIHYKSPADTLNQQLVSPSPRTPSNEKEETHNADNQHEHPVSATSSPKNPYTTTVAATCSIPPHSPSTPPSPSPTSESPPHSTAHYAH